MEAIELNLKLVTDEIKTLESFKSQVPEVKALITQSKRNQEVLTDRLKLRKERAVIRIKRAKELQFMRETLDEHVIEGEYLELNEIMFKKLVDVIKRAEKAGMDKGLLTKLVINYLLKLNN